MISSQAKTRAEVTHTGETLRLVIPAVIKPADAFLLSVWLAGWTLGAILLPFFPFVPDRPLLDIALRVVVIPFWLYAWGQGCRKLVYGVAGEERIILDSEQIMIRHQVFDLGPRQTYSLPDPVTWRLSSHGHWVSDADYPMQFGSRPGGAITLGSGRKAIRFGRNLAREQAKEILEAIRGFSSGTLSTDG